jgi:hypothetical protein
MRTQEAPGGAIRLARLEPIEPELRMSGQSAEVNAMTQSAGYDFQPAEGRMKAIE